jgi:hypothetical protein
MLRIVRTDETDNPATLTVEDTGVVSVYRKSPVYVEKRYWRANPKTNDALLSIDVSETGEILSLELLTYNGTIREAAFKRPFPSRPDCDHLIWVSTEHWNPPERKSPLKNAWRYLDCDARVMLHLADNALCVTVGDVAACSVLRMSSCLSFGLDPADHIVALYFDGFVGEARRELLKR